MGSRPGRPKSQEESLQALREYKATTRIIPDGEERANAISDIIASRILMLNDAVQRGKVNLRNVEEVRSVAFVYLDNCRKVGCLPTFEGLAFSLGYSRQHLYFIISDGRLTETAAFLDEMRTLFADLVQVASANRLTDNATSIFVLKSMTGMGFSDRGDVPNKPEIKDNGYEEMTPDDYRKKYGDLIGE